MLSYANANVQHIDVKNTEENGHATTVVSTKMQLIIIIVITTTKNAREAPEAACKPCHLIQLPNSMR